MAWDYERSKADLLAKYGEPDTGEEQADEPMGESETWRPVASEEDKAALLKHHGVSYANKVAGAAAASLNEYGANLIGATAGNIHAFGAEIATGHDPFNIMMAQNRDPDWEEKDRAREDLVLRADKWATDNAGGAIAGPVMEVLGGKHMEDTPDAEWRKERWAAPRPEQDQSTRPGTFGGDVAYAKVLGEWENRMGKYGDLQFSEELMNDPNIPDETKRAALFKALSDPDYRDAMRAARNENAANEAETERIAATGAIPDAVRLTNAAELYSKAREDYRANTKANDESALRHVAAGIRTQFSVADAIEKAGTHVYDTLSAPASAVTQRMGGHGWKSVGIQEARDFARASMEDDPYSFSTMILSAADNVGPLAGSIGQSLADIYGSKVMASGVATGNPYAVAGGAGLKAVGLWLGSGMIAMEQRGYIEEARRLGIPDEYAAVDSQEYGVLSGIVENHEQNMNKALLGLPAKAAKGTGGIAQWLLTKGVKNAAARQFVTWAGKQALSAAGEAGEEVVQKMLQDYKMKHSIEKYCKANRIDLNDWMAEHKNDNLPYTVSEDGKELLYDAKKSFKETGREAFAGFGAALVYGGIGGARSAAHYTRADSVANEVLGDRLGMDKKMLRQYSPEVKGDVIAVLASVDAADAKDIENSRQLLDKMDERDGTQGQHRQLFDKILHEVQLDEAATKNFKSNFVMPFVEDGGRREVKWETGTDDAGHDVFYVESDGIRIEKRVGVDEALQRQVDALPDGPEKTRLQRRISNADTGYYVRDLVHGTTRQAGSASNAYATARLLSSRNQMLASQREAKTRLVNGAFQRIVGDVQLKVFNTFGEMAAAYAQDQKENLENGTGYDPSNPFVTGADGTVYVALDNMATPMDGVKAALHEGGVHNGMRAWLEKPGNTQTAVEYLNSIGFPIESDLKKLRNRGFSEDSIVFRLNANLNRLQTREGGGYGRVRRTDAQGNMLPADEIKAKEDAARAELIEEALAYTAENVATPSLRQKMTNGLRNLVRSALGRNLQLTDSDLAVMMQDWRDSARRPKPKVETPAPAPSPAPGSASADAGATTAPSASTTTTEGPSAPRAAASAPEVVSTTEDVQRWLGENGIDLDGAVTEDLQAIAQRIESEGGERSGELLRQFSSLTETPLDELLPGRAKAEPAEATEAKPAKEKKPAKAAPKKKEAKEAATKKEAAKGPAKPAETAKPANYKPTEETNSEEAKTVTDEAPAPAERGAQPAAGAEAQRVEGQAAPRGEAGEVGGGPLPKTRDGLLQERKAAEKKIEKLEGVIDGWADKRGATPEMNRDGFANQVRASEAIARAKERIAEIDKALEEAAPKTEAPKPRKALAPKPKAEKESEAPKAVEKPKALAPKAKSAEAQKPTGPAKTEAKPAEKPAETPKSTEAKSAPKSTESPASQPAAPTQAATQSASLSPYEQIVADRYSSYHATEAYAADNGDFALKVQRDGKTRWLQFTAGGDLVVHNDGSANWQATKARRYGVKMNVAQQATSTAQTETKPAPKVEAPKAEAPKVEAPSAEAQKPTEAKPRKALAKKEAPAPKAEAQPQTNNTKRKSDEAPAAKTVPDAARNAVPEEPSLKPVERSKPMRSKTEKPMTDKVRRNRVKQLKGILDARNKERPITPELFRNGKEDGLNPNGLTLEYLKDLYDDPTDWHMELGLPRAEAEAVRDIIRSAYEDSYASRRRGKGLAGEGRGGFPKIIKKINYANAHPERMDSLALAQSEVVRALSDARSRGDDLAASIFDNWHEAMSRRVEGLTAEQKAKFNKELSKLNSKLSPKERKGRVSTSTEEGGERDIAVRDKNLDTIEGEAAADYAAEEARIAKQNEAEPELSEEQMKEKHRGGGRFSNIRSNDDDAQGATGAVVGESRNRSVRNQRTVTVNRVGEDGDVDYTWRNEDGEVIQQGILKKDQLDALAKANPEVWGAIASDPKPGMSVRFRRSTLDSSADSAYNNRARNFLDELQTLRGDESVARSTDFLNSLLRSINEQERTNDGRSANDDGRGAGQRVLRAYIQAIGRMGGPARAAAAIGILARTVETLEGASRDSGGSGQRTAGPARTNGKGRLLAAQTKALEAWARNNKRWAGNATAWAKRNYDYLGYGSRSEVYFDEARKRVVKLTDIGYADVMTGLDSVALFNLAADDSNRYSLIGFGKRGDTFCAILSQPFIDSADVDREATKRLTPSDLERHFNERLGRYGISVSRTGDRNFLFENADFEIADAIPGDNAVVLKADEDGETANVARMKNGRIVVLDADIEFKRDAKEALDSVVSSARFRRSTVTPEQDAAYMDAVNRGDMEAAQRMVREAAKSKGYALVSAREAMSRAGITIDNLGEIVTSASIMKTNPMFTEDIVVDSSGKIEHKRAASYLVSGDSIESKHFASLKDAIQYLQINGFETPKAIGFSRPVAEWPDVAQEGHESLSATATHQVASQVKDYLQSKKDADTASGDPVYIRFGKLPKSGRSRNYTEGFDEPGVSVFTGLKLKDGSVFVIPRTPQQLGTLLHARAQRRPVFIATGEVNGKGSDGEPTLANARIIKAHEYTFVPPKLFVNGDSVKRADVTYDDAGNVIPLSERFNEANPDIRFRRSGIYTGSAADYAERVPVLDKDGNVAGYRIENGPSLKHIGTGEGSQVYGWGLYGSSVRGVAEKYAGMRPSGQADEWMIPGVDEGLMSQGRQDALSALKRFRNLNEAKNRLIEVKERTGDAAKRRRAMEALRSLEKDNWTPRGSRIYEQTFFTDRAEGDESHLLKWYEPVSEEQFKWVLDALEGVGWKVIEDSDGANGGRMLTVSQTDKPQDGHLFFTKSDTGGNLYGSLRKMLGSPRAASEFLARAGIDGIKYPVDSYGTSVKDGDEVGWNYVSFRDDNIRVDHKWVDGQARFRRATDTIATRGPISSVESILASRATAPTASPGLMDRAETFWEKVRRNGQDAMLPMKGVEDELHIAPKDSVYLAEDARYGKDEHQTRELLNKTINPIIDEAQRRNVALSDVSAYLLAVHALKERNQMISDRTAGVVDDGAGITSQQAKDILKAYDDAGMTANLDAVAQMVWAMNRATLDRLVSAGLLSQKQADTWKRLSPHYVPLRTMLEEDDDRSVSAAITRLESNHALGRSSLPSSPLIFSFLQAEQAIARANKNAVRQKLAALVRAHPEMGRVIAEQPRTRALVNGQVKYVKDKGFTEKRSLKDNGRANVVQFKEGGDLKYIELKGERGELIARAVTKYGMHNLESGIGKLAMDINRWLANTRTSWAPSFLLRNVGYDTQQVLVLMNGDGLHKESAAYLKNLASGRAFKTALNYFKDGAFKGELADYMKEYVENGGLIKGGTSQGWGETVDLIQERVAELERKGASEKARKVMNKLALANSAVEVQTRLAVYAAMRAAGHGIEESIAYSRDITVNFNRKGEYGQLINTMFMFANASIQDMERIGRTLFGKEAARYGKNSKAALMRTIGTLVALGFLQGLANYLGGDDDDDEDMANISEYNKQSAWNVKLGKFGMYARLGRRGAYALAPYLGTKLAEVFCGKAKAGDASLDIAEYAFGLALDPLNSSVIMRGEDGRSVAIADSVANALSPTLIAPLTQIVTDRTFTGEKLTKSKWDRNLPNANNGRERTASWYKYGARAINAATGGDDFTAGFVDPSPEVLELLLTSIWGGVGSDALRTLSTASDIFTEHTIHGQRTPFLRDFARNVPDNTSRYYEAIARQSRYETSVKGYRDSRDHDKIKAFVKEHPSAAHDKAKKLEGIKKQIKELRELETRREGEPLERTRELRRKLQGKYIDLVGD